MTVRTEPAAAPGKAGKIALQLLLGAVSGGLAMSAMIWVLHRQEGLLEDPARMAALGVALVHALMALLVGIGSAVPQIGSRTLNVEDADEIVEQRSNLLVGSATFLLVAILLAALALAEGNGLDGILPPTVSGLIAGGCLVTLAIMMIAYRHRGDELMRAVSREASSWALGLIALVFGIWAALAHLGLAAPFPPLLFVAGFFALYLVAVFIAAARRGMMKPR